MSSQLLIWYDMISVLARFRLKVAHIYIATVWFRLVFETFFNKRKDGIAILCSYAERAYSFKTFFGTAVHVMKIDIKTVHVKIYDLHIHCKYRFLLFSDPHCRSLVTVVRQYWMKMTILIEEIECRIVIGNESRFIFKLLWLMCSHGSKYGPYTYKQIILILFWV